VVWCVGKCVGEFPPSLGQVLEVLGFFFGVLFCFCFFDEEVLFNLSLVFVWGM